MEHPIAVARLCLWEEDKAAALLHDVLEDTDTPESLIREQFGDKIADAVKLLTHLPEDSYEEYIGKLSENGMAARVKIADLSHNIRRDLAHPEKDNRRRLKKHEDALVRLLRYYDPADENEPFKPDIEPDKYVYWSWEDYNVESLGGADYEATYQIGPDGTRRLMSILFDHGFSGSPMEMLKAFFGGPFSESAFKKLCEAWDIRVEHSVWIS